MTIAALAVPAAAAAAEATVLKQWSSFSRLPFGRRLFNVLIGITVPYARSIAPEVVELSPGQTRARMADRRRVRNHLRSLHAVALTNLAELTGNLALMSRQPPKGARWYGSHRDCHRPSIQTICRPLACSRWPGPVRRSAPLRWIPLRARYLWCCACS